MWRFVLASAALFMLVGRSTSISGDESAVNQEGPPSGFTDTIRRISDARNRISSYDVTITVRVNNTLKEVTATDGKIYEVKQHPVSATLKMIYDREQSKFLVARHDVREDRQTGGKLESGWHVFGRTLEPLDDGERSVTRGRFLGSHTDFFDPLGLGLHFPHEFHNGTRFEELINNYLQWTDDFKRIDLADGRVRFERRDHWYVIDTKRGYWPIAMGRKFGRTSCMQTALKLGKSHGHYMPTYASVVLPDETVVLEFEWHSVNRPIPKERFTKEDLENRFGFGLEKVVERILREGCP